MIGALWILGFTVVVGLILYAFELRWRHSHRSELNNEQASPDDQTDPTNNPNASQSNGSQNGSQVGGNDTDGSQAGNASASSANSEAKTGAKDASQQKAQNESATSECCGLHLVCEKDSLSPMSGEVVYYDDDELDRFIGRTPDSYTPEEEEEFREVLMTLRPEDIAGWARSVTQRRLELPSSVRDELLMLVNEQRQHDRQS